MFSFEKLMQAFASIFTVSILSQTDAPPPAPTTLAPQTFAPKRLTKSSVKGYANCTLPWSDPLPSWFPLVFNSSTNEVIYPRKTANNSDWGIVIRRNKYFNVGCSVASNNSLSVYNDNNEVKIKCTTSGLKVSTTKVNFTELGCAKQVRENLVTTGSCNNQEFTAVDITFQGNSSQFPLINVCHDINTDATLHTHHFIIGAGLNPYEVSNNRPTFKEGSFYTKISANDAYTQNSQLNQVALLVGSQSLAEKYINPSKSLYFARGHLAPDGDMVHVYEQNATYYYINVIPQWQIINNGNWKALESALRNYARAQNVDLEIWTGGKDILKLDDVNGNQVEIYLSRDSTGKSRLPAPELTWKAVKDPVRNATVVVFIVNNPHLQEISKRLMVCKDVCSQISWITWDTKNIQKGYTYCCDIKSAKSVLPFLNENLSSTSLMT